MSTDAKIEATRLTGTRRNLRSWISVAILGGWILIADGICAWYLAWAAAMNSVVADRLPLWPYPYAKAETTAPPMQTPAITA